MNGENGSREVVELKTNTEHFSMLIDAAVDAIITVDQQGLVCFWNKAAEKLFGYNAEEIIGKSIIAIIPSEYVDAHKQAFARLIKTGVAMLGGNQIEVEGLKKNGEKFPAELSFSRFEIQGGIFFTCIIRDISPRRQLEKEINTSEKRMREIFKMMEGGGGVYQAIENGEDFIIIEHHRSFDWDDSTEHEEDLKGRRFLEVFPASKEYGLFHVLQRVWKSGIPENHPVSIYDGSELRSWRNNYVFKLSSGEVVALYNDITERKKMESRLVESESLFRSIFETSPDSINLNRLEDGKFVLVNDKFLEFTGYSRSEVIGRTAIDLKFWTEEDKRKHFFNQLIEKWQVNDFEAEFSCKDGKILTALVSAKLLSYQNTPHLLAVTKDITRLKQAEKDLLDAHKKLAEKYWISSQKLKESEIKYSILLEALLTGVYMCENDTIIFANNQFCEMLGYRKDELLTMSMSDLIFPEDREHYYRAFTVSAPMDNHQNEFEIRAVRRDGDIIYLSGKNTVIEYDGQEKILGNVANITQRIQAKMELQKSERELRLLSAQLLSAEERERKRIARDIHDSIGQVLSTIKFIVESSLFALAEQSYTTAQKGLEKIIPLTQQSIDEVRRIIMDLRPSMLDDLGLIATISWFCREFESVYKDIGIETKIQVEETDIPKTLKTVIYRILQEALNNAAKYSRTELILLKLVKTADNLELLIEDKGVGFDPLDTGSTGDERRGMGLASMKERALLSGGTYNVISAPGLGTKIKVVWPLMGR